MQKVVERLKELNLHIATMESCTGGGVANAITNIPGASEVLLFSARHSLQCARGVMDSIEIS